MSANSLKEKTLSGLVWQLAEKFGAQIVSFAVSLVLAQLLTPEDYGLVGLVTVFITIALVFAQSGMGQALVQKKDADEKDFATVFYYSLAFSALIYIVLFATADVIAAFYENPEFAPMIRVLGLTVIIGSVASVEQAIIQRSMRFKLFFAATASGTVVSGCIGVTMALCGFGVWSLIAQQLSNQLINLVVLTVILKWRPRGGFSFLRMKQLFGYSWKLLCSSLIETVYQDIYSLIIGKYYSSADLGFYNRGKQFPSLIIQNVNGAVNSVLFPVLSKIQDNAALMKNAVRRSIKVSTYLIFPLMAGLAAISEPLVLLLLSEKWLPAVPFIRFCCFTYAFWPIHTANLQGIKAFGRSDIYLRLEVIKKVIGIAVLILTIPHGLMAMMYGKCAVTVISSIVNAFPNKKLMNYSFAEQYKDMLPSVLMSALMLVVILPLEKMTIAPYAVMALQILAGAAVYIGASAIFKVESFNYIKETLLEILKKKG